MGSHSYFVLNEHIYFCDQPEGTHGLRWGRKQTGTNWNILCWEPRVHAKVYFLRLSNPSCLSLGKLSFLLVKFLSKIWYYDGWRVEKVYSLWCSGQPERCSTSRRERKTLERFLQNFSSEVPIRVFDICPYLQPPRYRIDNWDEMMMKRDERLTGHKRGQTVRLVQHAILACPFNTSWITVKPRCTARFRDEQRMDDRKYLGWSDQYQSFFLLGASLTDERGVLPWNV